MATTSRYSGRRPASQTILGALVVLLGVLLLLNTTDLYDTGFLLDYVPSLFVLVGVYALLASDFRNVAGPLVIVLVAGAWQLVALDVVAAGDLAQLWPLLVVVFGVSILLGRVRAKTKAVGDEFVSAVALFGGSEKRATSKSFAGADLTALFGGVELDLRDAAIEGGSGPARISATAAFGAVEIIVPRDWNVQMDVLPLFGAAEDERPRREEEHEDVDLVVTGFAAFGAVSVND